MMIVIIIMLMSRSSALGSLARGSAGNAEGAMMIDIMFTMVRQRML